MKVRRIPALLAVILTLFGSGQLIAQNTPRTATSRAVFFVS